METLSKWIRQSQSVLRCEADAYGQVLVKALTGQLIGPKRTCPITRLTRWDEKALGGQVRPSHLLLSNLCSGF
jgi:hypothetical protein